MAFAKGLALAYCPINAAMVSIGNNSDTPGRWPTCSALSASARSSAGAWVLKAVLVSMFY